MIVVITDPLRGDATGRLGTRSSFLRPPTRSSNDDEAYGSCRTCGKRTDRVSHEVLGRRTERAAHNAPQANILVGLRKMHEERKITAPADQRRKDLDPTIRRRFAPMSDRLARNR
jgi:hypothetical protein